MDEDSAIMACTTALAFSFGLRLGHLSCRHLPTIFLPGVLPVRGGPKPKVWARRRLWPQWAVINQLREIEMNEDRMSGKWKEVKGKIKEQWGKLTDDDLDVIAGKRDQLLGRIQQRHGVARDEAERQVDTFERQNPDYKLER
jgi:uncharacterized protein YjbJ (UPF0337 family)